MMDEPQARSTTRTQERASPTRSNFRFRGTSQESYPLRYISFHGFAIPLPSLEPLLALPKKSRLHPYIVICYGSNVTTGRHSPIVAPPQLLGTGRVASPRRPGQRHGAPILLGGEEFGGGRAGAPLRAAHDPIFFGGEQLQPISFFCGGGRPWGFRSSVSAHAFSPTLLFIREDPRNPWFISTSIQRPTKCALPCATNG